MPLDLSQDQLYKILHDTARHLLSAEASETRQRLLERTTEELWIVVQASVQLEDEPNFLF